MAGSCWLLIVWLLIVVLQESSVDPLGLLRDTKLQHSLPLASAYAALLDYPPTTEQLKRQRGRLDPTHREPLFTNLNRSVLTALALTALALTSGSSSTHCSSPGPQLMVFAIAALTYVEFPWVRMVPRHCCAATFSAWRLIVLLLVLLSRVACSRDFKATLDYVLYTRDSLAPTGLLELPSDSEVVAKPGDSLPNANWSSDHVCLMAEFQLLAHKNN
jgi:hypothetical protein